MPPSLATLLWLILLSLLLVFDPAKVDKVSPAIWVPVTWMFIVGSRLPSQWLGAPTGSSAEAMQEGNLTDGTVYTVLILLSIGIVMSRSVDWPGLFRRNSALTALLCFALVSVLWSDFAFITFKRWFRDLGNYLVILVALSDAHPLGAVRTLLRRFCYVLISLSVLMVRYFLHLAVIYSPWTGAPEYVGATLSKNMLGVLCLVSGIFFFWDTLTRWSDRRERQAKRVIVVNTVFIAMTLWLLHLSSSTTSQLCLGLGCFIVWVTRTKTVGRHPALRLLIPAGICVYLILTFGFGIDLNAEMAIAVGKDPTLTGRTVIWNAVLSTHTNPFVGTGYESFWLGPRVQQVWALTGPGINEAHNGYLEVYLNLGIVGLILLAGFLISSYRSIGTRLSALTPLYLALWAILPFYNVTESAFKGQLIFLAFLLGAIVVPRTRNVRAVSASKLSLNESPSRWTEVASV